MGFGQLLIILLCNNKPQLFNFVRVLSAFVGIEGQILTTERLFGGFLDEMLCITFQIIVFDGSQP